MKNILKAGALFFAVGLALALVAPPIAHLLGPSILGEAAVAQAVATPVLWTGVFFGVFGALDAAIRPLFNSIAGDDKAEAAKTAAATVPTPEPAVSKQVNITIVANKAEPKFRENLAVERGAPADEKYLGPRV